MKSDGRDFHGHDRPGFCQDRHGHTGFGAICGTKGRIEIPEFKNPQRATLFVDGEAPLTVERPFEVNGYEYEIREAERCVREGKLQSELMTWEQTVSVMRIMDEVRRQNGMRFPFEA